MPYKIPVLTKDPQFAVVRQLIAARFCAGAAISSSDLSQIIIWCREAEGRLTAENCPISAHYPNSWPKAYGTSSTSSTIVKAALQAYPALNSPYVDIADFP